MLARSVGLSPPETVAIGIECCYQNTGLGLTIALSAFPGETKWCYKLSLSECETCAPTIESNQTRAAHAARLLCVC